jgi:hypothetical protein
MKPKAYITFITIALLRACDLFLTFLYIPDLSSEYNPIVSIFGLSWPSFITFQFVILLIIFAFGFQYFSREPIVVNQSNLNFPDFIYCFFFGSLKPWPQRIFTKVTNFSPHIIFNGFLFISVSILVSIFAIMSNSLLLLNIRWYNLFLANHYHIFLPFVYSLIAFISFFGFFTIRYYKYRANIPYPK